MRVATGKCRDAASDAGHSLGLDDLMQLVDEHAHVLAVVDGRHDQVDAACLEGRFQHRREFGSLADALSCVQAATGVEVPVTSQPVGAVP